MNHNTTLGLIKYEDYPDVPQGLINEFNEKLLAVAERNSRLTQTISKKEQFRQVTISNSIRVYNINLTQNQIEDEIYEYIDGEWNRVLSMLELSCPCPLPVFIEKILEKRIDPVSHEVFRSHFDRERLIDDYENRNLAHSAEYLIRDVGNGPRVVSHTILLNKNYESGDIIAMCSAKDITEQYEARERLKDAQEAVAQSYGIISGLSQEYHTLWTVDADTMGMHLFRSTGHGTIYDAVQLGIDLMNYSRFIKTYVNEYVDVSDRERVAREVDAKIVLDHIEDGSIYTVNYLRNQLDGSKSYHQMAFAMCDLLSDNTQFVLGFRDVNSVILKEQKAEKEQLMAHDKLVEQYEIVEALSRDYLNIYKLNLNSGLVNIIKMDGYIFSDIDKDSKKTYQYEMLYHKYAEDRVYKDDIPKFCDAMDIDVVRDKLSQNGEYKGSYRVVANGRIGYYQFTFRTPQDDNTDTVIVAFKNIDSIVEDARERENLRILSETDQMTGLYNRVCGERKATEKIGDGVQGMLCIIDIDKFKNINDTFGHSVGDKAIIGVAACLKKAFRNQDIVFRLGGDEFAVMAINVYDDVVGERIIGRFFDNLDELEIQELGGYKITASVGAIIISGNQSELFEEYYKKADLCVYKSKDVDGNAFCFYHE